MVGLVATTAMFVAVVLAEWGEPLGGWGPVVAIDLVVAILVFGVTVPRAASSASLPRWSLVHSILAVVLLPAFWMGLSIVLGAAGILLGYRKLQAGGQSRDGSALSVTAILLGSLATVAGLVLPLVA